MTEREKLDNEQHENQEAWKEFHDNETLGNLDALKKDVKIENIHEKENIEHELNTIKEQVMFKEQKKWTYIPHEQIDDPEDLTLANIWREKAATNVEENINRYPWFLWTILRAISKRS